MAELAFELEYDGPALEAHEMGVRELAPALISRNNAWAFAMYARDRYGERC